MNTQFLNFLAYAILALIPGSLIAAGFYFLGPNAMGELLLVLTGATLVALPLTWAIVRVVGP